jgi:adenine/guanine phosphoribosyltransferase-like PRPP-binding protein
MKGKSLDVKIEKLKHRLYPWKMNNHWAYGFEDWANKAPKADNPDSARRLLYEAFQPLYDALIDQRVDDSRRHLALNCLDELLKLSATFLTGYYTGSEEVDFFRREAERIAPDIAELETVEYRSKERNIDHNEIYPKDIQSYLRRFLEHVRDKKIAKPEYILGCACGSSEIAIPLAEMLEVPMRFIRRSKRRGDRKPLILPEQKKEIAAQAQGKRVCCVDDYVDYGNTLRDMMNTINTYRPAIVFGSSVRGTSYQTQLTESMGEKGFHIWELKN